MADKFDPYREALIVEVETQWPDEYDDWEPTERARVERLLHQSPDQASQLEYVRTHTGFCRRIVVTPEDLTRVAREQTRGGRVREWERGRSMVHVFSPSPILYYLLTKHTD